MIRLSDTLVLPSKRSYYFPRILHNHRLLLRAIPHSQSCQMSPVDHFTMRDVSLAKDKAFIVSVFDASLAYMASFGSQAQWAHRCSHSDQVGSTKRSDRSKNRSKIQFPTPPMHFSFWFLRSKLRSRKFTTLIAEICSHAREMTDAVLELRLQIPNTFQRSTVSLTQPSTISFHSTSVGPISSSKIWPSPTRSMIPSERTTIIVLNTFCIRPAALLLVSDSNMNS